MSVTLPLYLTASYLTKQPGAGIPGGPSVFQALAHPPTTGVASEEAADDKAEALGVVDPDSAALARRTKHIDEIRDSYDSASILRVPA